VPVRLLEAVTTCVLSFIFIAFAVWTAFSAENTTLKPPPTSKVSSIELTGTLYCSLKRSVPLPFTGTMDSVLVQPGQKVDKGEALVIYHLSQETRRQIRQSLTSSSVSNLEIKLSDTQNEIYILKAKKIEQFILFQQQMATMENLIQTDQEIKILTKQVEILSEGLKEEKLLWQERLALFQKQLGTHITPENIPRRAYLRSPISGHVIWTHPCLRNNAEMEKSASLLEIGVMNPMLFRAKVQDLEVINPASGDKGEISINALPGRKFPGQISRVSWTPLNPSPDQPPYYLLELVVPNPDLILKEGLKGKSILRKHKQTGKIM